MLHFLELSYSLGSHELPDDYGLLLPSAISVLIGAWCLQTLNISRFDLSSAGRHMVEISQSIVPEARRGQSSCSLKVFI